MLLNGIFKTIMSDDYRRAPVLPCLLSPMPESRSWAALRSRPFFSLQLVASRLLRSVLLPLVTISPIPVNHANATGTTLAVLSIESESRLDRDTAALVTDGIRKEIGRSGRFQVLEQGRMAALGQDRSSRLTHCSSRECAVEAGKLLGAHTVVIGTLTRSGKTYYLSLSRIDVETETVAFVVEDKASGNREGLLQMSRAAVNKLLGDEKVILPRAAGPEDQRFLVREGTIFDSDTKLTWMRAPDAEGKAMTWDEANDSIQRLNKMNYGAYDNWRLPDKDELATLMRYANSRGVKKNLHELFIRIGFRNIKADYYWSATPSEDVTGLSWVIDLYGGVMSTADKKGKAYLWPVRTGPWLFEEPSVRP